MFYNELKHSGSRNQLHIMTYSTYQASGNFDIGTYRSAGMKLTEVEIMILMVSS